MDTSPAQKAISFALSGNWEEAIKANLEILKGNPEDTEALCRLARAYTETGKIPQARTTTKKVLALDPVNPIAIKFLEKLKTAKAGKNAVINHTSPESFLEEPGKTKLISLLNLGESKNFAGLDPGEEVKLVPYSHKVTIDTIDGKYIGRLPDDIAARLKNLIKEGNKYQVFIKSVTPKEVTIFVREVERGPKATDISSFPTEKIEYVSFTPPELVHDRPPITETGEETPD
ncbi:MAG: tetratricopeptide repeat protein [Candidatus Microgenomates bacterium]|jgi:tetratricopeptide (TPR) repeat protein